MKLHILLFSNLSLSGGGCESWLHKFLLSAEPLLNFYSEIHVYGIKAEPNIKNTVSQLINHKKIFFHLINLQNQSILKRLKTYFNKQQKLLHANCNDKDHLLSIGSLYEMWAIFRYRKNKNLKRIVWLRTLLVKHLVDRKTKYVLPLIAHIEKKCLKKADAVIANGEDTKAFYQKLYSLDTIITIPNAIIKETVRPNLHPFEKKKISIAYIGRLYKAKGFDAFIQSIDLFNQKPNPRIQFFIIGTGDMESEAKRVNTQYKNCTYIGQVPNNQIYDYLSSFDASVNLTLSNAGGGVSNSLLESIFANNLPICWNNKIFTQILDDSCALMLKEGDNEALIRGYHFLAENPTEAKKRLNKLNQLKDQYDFKTHINLFLNMIKSL